MSVDIRHVRHWLKDGPRWHVVTCTGPLGTFTACGRMVRYAVAPHQGEPPTRICRRCRLALKDAFLAGEPAP